jgi:tetratricopeptide (TPR) repeat protein
MKLFFFILNLFLFCGTSFAIHTEPFSEESGDPIIYLNDDVSYQILQKLESQDLRSCRLVCWQWRARIDYILGEYFKIKREVPVLNHLTETDFARKILMEQGCTSFKKKEFKESFDCFSTASFIKPGNAQAIYMVGCLFLRGRGVERSVREGLYQMQRAADAGFAPAYFDLGLFHYNGCTEVDYGDAEGHIDYRQAFYFFEKASELKHANAIYHLGLMYGRAQHVEENFEKARQLITEAAALKYEAAIDCCEKIEKWGIEVLKNSMNHTSSS